jgi:cytochrome c biogenesis protein CcmG/thiol:disulfide interchange protein DsbE
MERDSKILSAIAVAILVVAIGVVAYANFASTGDVGQVLNDGGKVALEPSSSEGPVAAGKLAPDFTLKTLNGETISLTSLRGKVVFLNVWATWCGPCREEMPSIQALYDEFSHEPDFVVLAVSEDSAGRGAVDSYVRGNAFRFDVLLDPQNLVGDAYDVSGIPETFIIDRTGRIVAHHVGPYDWSKAEMRDALHQLIDVKEKETAKAG